MYTLKSLEGRKRALKAPSIKQAKLWLVVRFLNEILYSAIATAPAACMYSELRTKANEEAALNKSEMELQVVHLLVANLLKL